MVEFYHSKVDAVGLNIKNPKVEKKIRDLAATTGESLTEAVENAVTERHDRIKAKSKPRTAEEFLESIRPLQERVAAERAARGDTRTSQELMDELYDEHGLPK
jgi:antitoxin VapB